MEIAVVEWGSDRWRKEVVLRDEVLRKPLGLNFNLEQLDAEKDDIHIVACDEGCVIGCLVLSRTSVTSVKMRQVAVAQSIQRRGIGRALVKFSESVANSIGVGEIVLNSRDSAIDFYLSLGYEVFGEPFVEVTIPHRSMRKRL